MSFLRVCTAAAALALGGLGAAAARGQDVSQASRQEEKEDYYRRWLSQDVVYIITEDEKAVFEKLATPAEKDRFIEQFWHRRDTDLATAVNEFKEEHYRRIAYANERFASGIPGWRTDRGRIYIIHGEPDFIQSNPGGPHQRAFEEGGGMTSVYPFEIWRYRHIEGVGTNVELEFVDRDGANQYRLALNPSEKDALLTVPGAGLTLAEQMGMVEKGDRPDFQPGNRETYPLMGNRVQDSLFQRYERFAKAQAVQPIRYADLKQIVEVNIGYDSLPFEVQPHYFRLNDQSVLVTITVKVSNRELTFRPENGVRVARLAVYGIVTSMANRIAHEFDDDLAVSFSEEALAAKGSTGFSLYQKTVSIDQGMRHKIDIVVKDLVSSKIGTQRLALLPPDFADGLAASSVVLSNHIMELARVPENDEMFVLGDVKVQPSLDNAFLQGEPFGAYLQLYHAGMDQTTLSPSLSLSYQILKGGEVVAESVDEAGESIQYYSGQRIVLLKNLLMKPLEPGRYRLRISVQDRIGGQSVTLQSNFQIKERPEAAEGR